MHKFCRNPLYRKKLDTKTVFVGDVPIGGDNPIVIQSMTNTDTMDTRACVEQIRRLSDCGCQIVRLATPTVKSARNLENIRNELHRVSCFIPIAADVHFQSKIAFEAVKYADKVRINPGNFYEKVDFKHREYSDELNNEAIKLIEGEMVRLIEQAKRYDVALRIGVNHGSLSERMMRKYGNTIEGMVESAMEFLILFQKHHYDNLVFSMKSSSTAVMIGAYRQLVERMRDTGTYYPLHLGVTEAGFGMEARIKSSVGIGSLLADGLGDTIRVSLTEPPMNEIPVAKSLIEVYSDNITQTQSETISDYINSPPFAETLFDKDKRKHSGVISLRELLIGNDYPVRVELNLDKAHTKDLSQLETYFKDETFPIEIININDEHMTDELLNHTLSYNIPVSMNVSSIETLKRCYKSVDKIIVNIKDSINDALLDEARSYCEKYSKVLQINFNTKYSNWEMLADKVLSDNHLTNKVLGLVSVDLVHSYRRLWLIAQKHKLNPVLNIINPLQQKHRNQNEKALLKMASEMGNLLIDGFGSIISLNIGNNGIDTVLSYAYTVLQSSGVRSTQAEFISCPACGRTQFDIEKTAELVKRHTKHLKGVKIAVMGCIVNGPGEMGDADFGYIGGSKGKVNLYVKGERVSRNIEEEEALSELIKLIRKHGKWIEPR